MSNFPSIFPFWWMLCTSLLALAMSFVLLRWRFHKDVSVLESALLAVVVGASVLGWRLSANVPQFNDDPIGGLSPNDWLSPAITYVCLGLYASIRVPGELPCWQRLRALLTLVTFVVNVVAI